MKRTALTCSLLLVMSMVAVAAAQDRLGGRTVPRQISGVIDGRFVFEGPAEGPWTTVGDATGPLTHLGLAHLRTTHRAYPDTGQLVGTFTLVAANGDEIWGTYEGFAAWTPDYTAVLGEVLLLVEGGTGRFAQATGTIHAAFLETFDDPTWASAGVVWTLHGTVGY
jgi:hypothetical protein